ncbi:hypothetical protein C8R43DRAFT_266508 [Mycena crocata]|nr:hypothetical protein C8R43DRAFT_266508 [Mycena crocata]
MAQLGGARVGMAPPVFGAKPPMKTRQSGEVPSVKRADSVSSVKSAESASMKSSASPPTSPPIPGATLSTSAVPSAGVDTNTPALNNAFSPNEVNKESNVDDIVAGGLHFSYVLAVILLILTRFYYYRCYSRHLLPSASARGIPSSHSQRRTRR